MLPDRDDGADAAGLRKFAVGEVLLPDVPAAGLVATCLVPEMFPAGLAGVTPETGLAVVAVYLSRTVEFVLVTVVLAGAVAETLPELTRLGAEPDSI